MTRREPVKAQAKARERLRILEAGLRRAARSPGDADSIHRLRVAIRRFTQVLRVFGGVFSHHRRMRRRLRGLMDLCGEVRNCDIALQVLADAGVPANPALEKSLKLRRARAGRELGELLADRDIRAGMRRWRGWLTAKPGHPNPVQVLPRLSREFRHSGAAASKAGADFEQMHEFRLLVKKLRYTVEILGSARPQLTALRGLQERLGAINDCVTTANLMDDTAVSAAQKRRIKAALSRLLARRASEFRAYWRSQFSNQRRKK